eukprot:scaffold63830_cov18-Tisochrysis_lutea.AAC.2
MSYIYRNETCRETVSFSASNILLPAPVNFCVRTGISQIESGATNVPTYILKPSGGTMGRGIALVQTGTSAETAALYVAASGILASSMHVLPQQAGRAVMLSAYAPRQPELSSLYQQSNRAMKRIFKNVHGLAASRSAPTADNLRSATMHLTNYAINRGAPSVQHQNDAAVWFCIGPGTRGHHRVSQLLTSNILRGIGSLPCQ